MDPNKEAFMRNPNPSPLPIPTSWPGSKKNWPAGRELLTDPQHRLEIKRFAYMGSKASKLTWLFAPLLGFQRWTTLPRLLLTLALLACTVIALPVAQAVGPNAVRPGFNANSLAGNDDGSTGLVPIGISINFFGTTYTDLFVNNNGNITLDAALGNFTPFDLASTSREIIAPFFADVDTQGGNVVTYGQGTVDGRPAFGVTWPAVGCYSQTTSVLNIFQVILTDRSDTGVANFDIEFNYDQIGRPVRQAAAARNASEGILSAWATRTVRAPRGRSSSSRGLP